MSDTKTEMKLTKTINFNADDPNDRDLMQYANRFGNLPENKGIPLASAIRNFLETKLLEYLNKKENQASAY